MPVDPIIIIGFIVRPSIVFVSSPRSCEDRYRATLNSTFFRRFKRIDVDFLLFLSLSLLTFFFFIGLALRVRECSRRKGETHNIKLVFTFFVLYVFIELFEARCESTIVLSDMTTP